MNAEDVRKFKEECKKKGEEMPDGPWKEGPHRIDFEHAGLDCLVLRNTIMFHLCGYVGVPKGHPLYGKSYDNVDVAAHGGLSFSGNCHQHICHASEKNEDDIWWFGFDCAHSGDLVPGILAAGVNFSWFSQGYDTYKDVPFVVSETKRLAEQLAELKGGIHG